MILTVNQRLAGHLKGQLDLERSALAQKAWVSRDVLPLDVWLKKLWASNFLETTHLLTPQQERMLWEEILDAKLKFDLASKDQILEKIQQAYFFLNRWGLSLEDLKFFAKSEGHYFFVEALSVFEGFCEKKHYLPEVKIPSYLIDSGFAQKLSFPKKITLVGFDSVYPQLAQFFSFLEKEKGCLIEEKMFFGGAKQSDAVRISFDSLDEEINQIALWAKSRLSANPLEKIGCVFLDLSSIKHKVRRAFEDIFKGDSHFNISLGDPLSSYPVVQAALFLFSLCIHASVNRADLLAFMHSPFYLASDAELSLKSESFLAFLREEVGQISLEKCVSFFMQTSLKSSDFLSALKVFLEKKESVKNKKKSPSEWVKWFVSQLEVMGWPGERGLSHLEKKLVERFFELIGGFSGLDLVASDLTLSEAFGSLKALAEKTLFQFGEAQKNPVQIVGFLESAGLQFDALWVAGMSGDAWPRLSSPNPLIPFELQRKVGMPHSSPEKEYELSESITERFYQSADYLICSCSKAPEEKEVFFSPLISKLQEVSPSFLQVTKEADISSKASSQAVCELFLDNEDIPLRGWETPGGGTGILKHQSACSFKAFAQTRLRVETLFRPALGVSLMVKGVLVHEVMERFWREVKDHAGLQGLDDDALSKVLLKCVSQSLVRFVRMRPWLDLGVVFSVEKNRLLTLLANWLAIERQRDFFKVLYVEKPYRAKVGSLDFSIKIDRIDQLENGKSVIIDYKTGKIYPKAWEGIRPDEPQLLLYWLVNDEPVSAIVFAQMHPEKLAFKGVGECSECLPGVKGSEVLFELNWRELKERWRKILADLSEAFCSGKILLDPKQKDVTCGQCGMQALCRIHEVSEC